MKRITIAIALALTLSLLLGACQPAAITQPPAATATPLQATAAPVAIKFILLPILDALPLYVADQKGYFAEQGVQVQFIPASSAVERDQLMAAGQADALINDLLSVVLYNRDSIQVQVVGFARTASKDVSLYRIVAAPLSGLSKPADLAGVPIGISQSSVIDYVTDRLLQAEGLTPDQIKTVVVPKIPDRLALLSKGEIKAATLPEPFSTLAVNSGGTVILDDTSHPEYGNSVISFLKAFIDSHPKAVTGLLAAFQKAVADINANPGGWGSILRQYKLLPDALVDTFTDTVFPPASLPTAAQFNDVVQWALGRNLISKAVDYQQAVNPGLRP
jgi:NitT/TauT family transport system substrate-binding protein